MAKRSLTFPYRRSLPMLRSCPPYGFCIVVLLTSLGCAVPVDLEAERETLMRLHQQQQDAHLTYDAALFVDMFHEPIVQLRDGTIYERDRATNLARVQRYFDTVTFQAWENVEPPRVRISADGTMAYIIVHKRVELTFEDDAGDTQREHTIFAWLETWEKIEGVWKLMAAASTDKVGP